MKISFIIAVYNRDRYIKKCINSILSQTYTDFELIIINDGSTDHSEDVIKEFKDDRIRYFTLSHQGCWSAKNYGITKSQGEYICFIDSDDFISNDFLEIGVNAVYCNPSYEYFYPTALNIIKEDETPTGSIWRYISYSLSEREKLIKLFWEHQIGGIPHPASLINKQVFEKNGLYNDSFYNLSDSAYTISNAMNIKFLLVPELKHYYNRQHREQTNANNNERIRTYSEILDEIIEKYPTEYFLGFAMNKESNDFLNICIHKFMTLAQNTPHKEHYQKKAEKYLKELRNKVSLS